MLSDLGICAEGGKAFGLLGRNGAGKTTTIRILMNVFPAVSGELLIDGEKSSRAMELLITSAKPTSMMFGKVIASCLAGLLQLVAIFVLHSCSLILTKAIGAIT